MKLVLREISLRLGEDESLLPAKVARYLDLPTAQIKNLTVMRRGIDARKKPDVRRTFSVTFTTQEPEALLHKYAADRRLAVAPEPPVLPEWRIHCRHSALVVGMGPAGLFAALHLARRGVDVTLIERGRSVEARSDDVRRFWTDAELDPVSNVQFGEGGAGTFSDGKLTTRVNSVWHRLVLQTLVDCGAPAEILVDAKPHLGTDVLRTVLVRFRQLLQEAGVTIHFETRLDSLEVTGGRITAGICGERSYACDSLILAPGHSARDTYRMLDSFGVKMEAKPFAIGLRVEHPRELINRIQFGHADHPGLPTADYSLRYNDRATGRGFYSFCMCPGGEVITASSEAGGMVVNGMSSSRRMARHSNSALVVAVTPDDFPGADPLAGVRFQQRWEEAAFVAGGSDYRAPAQNLLTFLGGGHGPIDSSCRPGVREADLTTVLPPVVCEVMRRGLPHFDRTMKGFVTREATLVGIESRTSAPLRIIRDADSGSSVSHPGLYPAGEGAGYAGGIMSAAIDGIKTAEKIAGRFSCGDGY